jgi:hypothetical protein
LAGHARYTAFLDACILHPTTTADVLVSLAVQGLFAAKWSRTVEAEWMNSVVRVRPELAGRLDKRRDHMRQALPDWEVPLDQFQPLIPSLVLPDLDDRHVLAAAIAGHADCIVTANLKDFPAAVLAPHGIEALHPDDFVVMQLDLDPVASLTALKAMRARMRNPPRSPEEFLGLLERTGLALTAQRLRDAIDLI